MRDPIRWAGAYAVITGILAVVFAWAILTGPYHAVERSDYMTYQTAVRIVLEARGDCLYTLECQSTAQRDLIGEKISFEDGVLPFNSPPWLAALLVPLGSLPLEVGFALFALLSLVLLALAAWRLAWGGAATRLIATLLVLSAWPTTMGAVRGQATLAVAGLLGLSAAAALAGRQMHSGMVLGLAVLKPTLMPLLSLQWLIERRWRALGAAAAVAVGLLILAAVVISPKAVADYPTFALGLVGGDSSPAIHVAQMINWRGAALRLGVEDSVAATVATIATLGMVGAAWWWVRHSARATALRAAIAFVATPLVIPYANQHEAILATLGILLALAALEEIRLPLAIAAISGQAVLWVGPVLTQEEGGWLLFGTLLVALVALEALAWREQARYFRPVPVPPGTD